MRPDHFPAFTRAYEQRRAALIVQGMHGCRIDNLEYFPTFPITAYGAALAGDCHGVIVGKYVAHFAYVHRDRGFVVEVLTGPWRCDCQAERILRDAAEVQHGIRITLVPAWPSRKGQAHA